MTPSSTELASAASATVGGVAWCRKELSVVVGLVTVERTLAGAGAAVGVGDRIGEARRPGITGGRREGDRLRLGIIAHRSVRPDRSRR